MGSATTHAVYGAVQFVDFDPKFIRLCVGSFLKTDKPGSSCYSCACAIRTPRGFSLRAHSLPDIDDIFWEKPSTPILDTIDSPLRLKNMSLKELKELANEIRKEMSSESPAKFKSSKPSLCVVDLTVAMHHVFCAPVDKILWDDEEQTYAHKILTGRRLKIQTMKQRIPHPIVKSQSETEYDPFGVGHGCNSVSAGLGIAVARDIKGVREKIVTVINNETTLAGQVYEAMSNAGYFDSDLIVILNDRRHSLHRSPEEGTKTSVNALSSTLSRVQSSKSFRQFREAMKAITKSMGEGMHELAAKVDEYTRGMIGPRGATLFEELGLYYIGPVDGHNMEDLVSVLQEVAALDSMGPVLVHVVTEEDEGFQFGQIEEKTFARTYTYSDCFAEALVGEAKRDKDIVVVYAGKEMESSFQLFQKELPGRFFDVGMAEQHAVTFSAGLARGGLKPFCVIPSTFLQRAYDQVVHDVDRQKIPVRFVITSAGLVGVDGARQCGAFDITFMGCLPNMVVMAPADEDELVDMVSTAIKIDDRPSCFRYPRGTIAGMGSSRRCGIPFEIGKWKGLACGQDVALVGYGSMVRNCLKAQFVLAKRGVEVTVVNARFCKPLDGDLLRQLCANHSFIVTVEEGSIGGFGSHVAQFIALDGDLDGIAKWRPIVLPDYYIEDGLPTEQLSLAGLSGTHIAATVLRLMGRTHEALLLMR